MEEMAFAIGQTFYQRIFLFRVTNSLAAPPRDD